MQNGGSARVLRDSCSHSALLSTADPMPVDLASAAPRSQDRSSGPHGSALPDMDFRSRPALTFRLISSPNPAARTGARHGGLDLSARAAVLAGTSWAAITRHGIVSPRRSSPVRGVASTTTPNQRPRIFQPSIRTSTPVSSSRHSRHMSSGCTMPATAARWGRTPASRRAAIRTSAGVRTLTTTAWAHTGLDDHRGGPSTRWAALEPAARLAGAAVPAAGAGNLVYGPGYRPRVIAKAVGDRGGVGTMGRPGPAPLPREAGCVQGLRGARPGRLNGGS